MNTARDVLNMAGGASLVLLPVVFGWCLRLRRQLLALYAPEAVAGRTRSGIRRTNRQARATMMRLATQRAMAQQGMVWPGGRDVNRTIDGELAE